MALACRVGLLPCYTESVPFGESFSIIYFSIGSHRFCTGVTDGRTDPLIETRYGRTRQNITHSREKRLVGPTNQLAKQV